MSARVVFATGNAHKLSELEAILAPAWEGFAPGVVARMSDFGVSDPVEDGASFAENSLIKARHVCEATGLPAIADDSGITVDVMGGAPGILSARWCGRHGDDRANLDLLIEQLHDVPVKNRGAAFVSVAALVMPDGREFIEEGIVRGTLLDHPQGEGGFGYDPIFVPEGYSVTTAQMSPEEKNAISHRGIAFRALMPRIIEALSA